MQTKISIIVPVYNAEKQINTCLDSLVNQDLEQIEIICVDDQSSDSSLELLEAYAAKDSRIKVISQTNKGPGGARNTGLDAAQGEFIIFVDADDYIPRDYCSKMYDAAVKYNADIVAVGMKKVYPSHTKDRAVVKQEAVYNTPQEKFDTIGYSSMFYVMNKMLRSQKLEQIGLRFEQGVYYEDVMFMARVFCEMGALVTVPHVYYMYVNQSTGITKGAQTPKKQLDKYHAHKSFVEYCRANNITIDAKRKNITVRYWAFMGITLLKIKECKNVRTWRLFDFLPVYKKRI